MLFARRDIEAAGAGAAGQDESPAAKRGKPEAASGARPTLTRSEIVVAAAVLALFVAGIFCIFLAAPHREFGQILRLPRSLADVRLLKNPLVIYRLILWWLIAIPTIREYNSYLQDSKPVKKVGAFCWLSLAICIVELLICMKFGHGLFHDPMPTWLIIFWSSAGIVLVIFLLAWSWRNHQKFRRKRL